MSKQYFGTDGIRGKVGEEPITPAFMLRLGYAAGQVLTKLSSDQAKGARPSVLIGKDTRISGYMFESALEAGLSAAGVDVLMTGPMPTPAVAYLTRALRAQAGIVISASHNPFYDNGIKFFSSLGTKLPDEVEHEIEEALAQPMQVVDSAKLGKVRRVKDAAGRYVEFCKSTFSNHLSLRGMKIVLDCAHGATYQVAPAVFHELGADLVMIGDHPDGLNINQEVGSTHPEALKKAVIEHQADLGIAFDGDGDRLMMIDNEGALYDGDQLLYVIAKTRQVNGDLSGGVVGTLMTNLGFEHRLAQLSIPFKRAKVGDRYVLELLNDQGWQIGGENSGHILVLDKHSSGDGIISALQVLQALAQMQQPLNALVDDLTMYPQVLINVTVTKKVDLDHPAILYAVEEAENKLGNAGRVLLRASGTEPKVRVMVEGIDHTLVQNLAENIALAVRNVA